MIDVAFASSSPTNIECQYFKNVPPFPLPLAARPAVHCRGSLDQRSWLLVLSKSFHRHAHPPPSTAPMRFCLCVVFKISYSFCVVLNSMSDWPASRARRLATAGAGILVIEKGSGRKEHAALSFPSPVIHSVRHCFLQVGFLSGHIRLFLVCGLHFLQVKCYLVDLAGEFIRRPDSIVLNDRRLSIFTDIGAFICRVRWIFFRLLID